MHVRRHKKAVKGKWDDVFHKNDEVSEMSDLIAAISTPLSPSAIGILRLSGPGAAAAADRVFRARSGRPLAEAPSRTLVYGSLLDREGRVVDQVLATVSRAPHSYTGEDTAELQCHGSPMVLSLSLIHI